MPITEAEFDKIICSVNVPLLAIVLNQETEPEPENKPETNANQQINTDTPISSHEEQALGETKKRYCPECKNFRQAKCPVDNYGYLPTDAEVPLKCPGYSYKGTLEDIGHD